MSNRPIYSFQQYLDRNRKLFQDWMDKISQKRMIDNKHVTLFDVATTEYINGDPEQLLYEFVLFHTGHRSYA